MYELKKEKLLSEIKGGRGNVLSNTEGTVFRMREVTCNDYNTSTVL